MATASRRLRFPSLCGRARRSGGPKLVRPTRQPPCAHPSTRRRLLSPLSCIAYGWAIALGGRWDAKISSALFFPHSGPPAPHPLLTSLTAQPASGDASILTSGECELLRSDAKVRRRRAPRVTPHSHRLVHLVGHGRASCHVRSASLCLQRARWPGARRCVERCSTPSPETALIGMEASERNGRVAPTTWPRHSPSSADGRSLP